MISASEQPRPTCPPRCRMHGLKKGGMRRLTEAGGTAHELMAFSGQKTPGFPLQRVQIAF